MKGTLLFLIWATCGVSLAIAQKGSSTTPARDPLIRNPGEGTKNGVVKVSERLACSTLCQYKQPAESAFKTISEMGYKWVDLSCMNWAPHVNVPRLVEDFEREACRVETGLNNYGLSVANLTFDSVDMDHFDAYQKQFESVVKLAVRLKGRLINLMAASPKVDRQGYVDKLRKLQAVAEKNGIILTLETHCNQITERPADAEWLCRQVPGLGLTLDPSHYYAGPNQGASYDELIPFVQGTGFRAGGTNWAQIQLPWGEGPIDFKGVVQKLEKAGYKGFYVAEYIEGFSKVEPLGESRRFLEWGRKL